MTVRLRPLYALLVLVVLALAGASAAHALLGARLRTSGSRAQGLHIANQITLGALSASGDGNAAPVQIASAVQLGTVTASGSGNAYPAGIAVTSQQGNVTRSINGVQINDDSFNYTGYLSDTNTGWASFGPWDEVYGHSWAKLYADGSQLRVNALQTQAGACYAASTSDTSSIWLSAGNGYTFTGGVTLRSGNGTASVTGLGYQVYLDTVTSLQWKKVVIARNGTVVSNTTISGVSYNSGHRLKARMSGGTITVYVDGVQMASYTDPTPLPAGHPGLFIVSTTGSADATTRSDDWTDEGGSSAPVLADWTSKPPAGTALRTDGHWSVTGLVAAYPLNEGSGLPKDVVSNVSATTMATGVAWGSDGISSTAVNGAYLRFPNTAAIAASNPTAISYLAAVTWSGANPDADTEQAFMGGPYASSFTVISASGALKQSRSTSGGYPSFTTSSVIPQNVKKTVAAVFPTYGSAAPKAYIDGVEASYASTNIGNGTLTDHSTRTVDFMASWNNSYAYNFKGSLHWALIYNRALTAAEVQSLTTNPWQIFQPH